MGIFKVIFRESFRYYLRNFPIRDGKMFLYQLVNKSLAPSAERVEVKTKSGFKLILDLNEHSQRMIFFGNYDERYEISMLQKILLPGDTFWDIGANIGFYTLTASLLVGEQGTVVAFEPGPESWRALMTNLSLNRISNVLPLKMAVSDKCGWVTLYSQPGIADGGGSIIPPPDASVREDLCPSITLDRFYQDQGLGPPTLLKIDVEGAEDLVLAGGLNLLSGDTPPLLLVEMNDRQAVGKLLQGLGFAGVHLQRRKWYLCPDLAAAKSRNMLWFHPDHDWHWERVKKIPIIGDK